jgi:molybdopterin converting factor small subunit
MIDVQLYSILREKLPREARGRATLQLGDGATVEDLLAKLDIERNVVISVNDEHARDTDRKLQDGDLVRIFSSVSGGEGRRQWISSKRKESL